MTVLKPEVWLSIVAALAMTAFMIWILDKYSPYSAQNNKPKYEQFRYICILIILYEYAMWQFATIYRYSVIILTENSHHDNIIRFLYVFQKKKKRYIIISYYYLYIFFG
jgi:hypothetical protein